MKLIIMSVRDRAADCYGQPFFVPAIGRALRSFQDEINRAAEDNPLYKHPEDFDLYQLGEFEDGDATFKLLDRPQQVAVGKDCSNKE